MGKYIFVGAGRRLSPVQAEEYSYNPVKFLYVFRFSQTHERWKLLK
jgi:hypothetical protein